MSYKPIETVQFSLNFLQIDLVRVNRISCRYFYSSQRRGSPLIEITNFTYLAEFILAFSIAVSHTSVQHLPTSFCFKLLLEI